MVSTLPANRIVPALLALFAPLSLGLIPAFASRAALALPEEAASGSSHAEPARAAAYRALADSLDLELRRLLDAWFPRVIDETRGGYFECFASDWSKKREEGKFLVYQARQAWVSAEASAYLPARREEFLAHALHGLRFLDERMRDREFGALYCRLDPEGKPVPGLSDEKHAYALSFGIYAASALHGRTKDPRALALAKDIFEWLETHAHDSASGGYFESLTRRGERRLSSGPRDSDGIGTLVGYKSMNTHIHLLEALSALHHEWPEARVRVRLEELFRIVRDRIAVEPGCLNLFFTPDWRAVPAHDSFGHDIETAFLLVEAAESLGIPEDPAVWRVARSLVDHALDWGFDERYGGFFEKGEAFAPAHDTAKVWWTQAEGLNALILMEERFGRETRRYFDAMEKQWGFVREHQIDAEHGGWHGYLTREGQVTGNDDKAGPWKAAYHTGRALMTSAARLRRMAGG